MAAYIRRNLLEELVCGLNFSILWNKTYLRTEYCYKYMLTSTSEIYSALYCLLNIVCITFSYKGSGKIFNPLNPELNPICYLLALLGAHHFLHVSRIRVKLLTFRLLMSYIYMEHPFLMFLDHTQRRSTVGRTPLDE